jgi:3-isopropylmalate/(R)-2-methylmalate dehydratase large subunit
MTLEKTMKRPGRLRFGGRVLYLTEDVSLIRQQLEEGAQLEYEPGRALMNNISTDEITPGWVCFYYDETLGEYVYVGMREGAVKKLVARDGAVRGEGRGVAARHRPDHREDLRAELPEHRVADLDRLRVD